MRRVAIHGWVAGQGSGVMYTGLFHQWIVVSELHYDQGEITEPKTAVYAIIEKDDGMIELETYRSVQFLPVKGIP